MKMLREVWFAVFTLALAGCNNPQLANIGNALRDDDGDGWLNTTNNLTTLTLSTAMFPVPGNYRVVVDEIRFPFIPQVDTAIRVSPATALTVMPLGIPVARRVGGAWILNSSAAIPYSSRVELQRLSPGGGVVSLGSVTVSYNSLEQNVPDTVNIGGAALLFGTTRTQFSDPNPANAAGDSDADSIPEDQEAAIARIFGGIGDPTRRDLHLIVGWTHNYERLVNSTRELLRSTFFARGIDMWIDDGMLNGVPGEGGFMTLNGAVVVHSAPPTPGSPPIPPTPAIPATPVSPAVPATPGSPGVPPTPPVPATAITVTNAATVRAQNIAPSASRFAYFALLTEDHFIRGGGRAFGEANRIPGNHLAMRGRLAPLPADIKDYQAGVLMHELGHLLGLCHPTQSSGLPGTPSCPSGTIPTGEQNPATTIMGAPSENPPIVLGPVPFPNPLGLVDALRRPIDYSPTQWTNIMLGAGLRP